EKQGASGRGLLAAAGLDADAGKETDDREQESDKNSGSSELKEGAAEPKGKKRKKAKTKHESSLWNWIGRYQKHREEQRKKPHTPGVWVIYFSLAALPLFALGQSLVSPDDTERRWRTFAQIAIYVASGLALLVTTSLLGLRRYLRQRKVKAPAAMTASWLGLGGVLIVVFLVLGAFLPRPHSEVPWFGLQRAGKSEREASKYAQLQSNSGTGEGAEGEQAEKGDGKASGKNGEAGGGEGEKGGGGKGEGKSSGGSKDAKSGGGNSGNQSNGSKKSGDDRNSSSRDEQDKDSRSGGQADKDGNDAKGQSGDRSRPGSSSPPKTGAMAAVEKIAGVLKWIVFAAVAFLVIVGVILLVLRYLA